MSPPATTVSSTRGSLRQTVRAPRESDGVGNALRQIFSGGQGVPQDFRALIGRLDKED